MLGMWMNLTNTQNFWYTYQFDRKILVQIQICVKHVDENMYFSSHAWLYLCKVVPMWAHYDMAIDHDLANMHRYFVPQDLPNLVLISQVIHQAKLNDHPPHGMFYLPGWTAKWIQFHFDQVLLNIPMPEEFVNWTEWTGSWPDQAGKLKWTNFLNDF